MNPVRTAYNALKSILGRVGLRDPSEPPTTIRIKVYEGFDPFTNYEGVMSKVIVHRLLYDSPTLTIKSGSASAFAYSTRIEIHK